MNEDYTVWKTENSEWWKKTEKRRKERKESYEENDKDVGKASFIADEYYSFVDIGILLQYYKIILFTLMQVKSSVSIGCVWSLLRSLIGGICACVFILVYVGLSLTFSNIEIVNKKMGGEEVIIISVWISSYNYRTTVHHPLRVIPCYKTLFIDSSVTL